MRNHRDRIERKTKPCRAIKCPRQVRRDALFCDQHYRMLERTPEQRRIPENREAPAIAGAILATAHIAAVNAAIQRIARTEGRRAVLREAIHFHDPAEPVGDQVYALPIYLDPGSVLPF